ncbi:MAG: hypothetical protein AABW91_01735 [Nanoarchaeota archaeon]
MRNLGEKIEEQLDFDFDYIPSPLELIEETKSSGRTYLKLKTFDEMVDYLIKGKGRLIPGPRSFSPNRWDDLRYRAAV